MKFWCWLGVYYLWSYHCNDICQSTPFHFDTGVYNYFWHISFIFSKHNRKFTIPVTVSDKFKDCRMLYQLVVSNYMGHGNTKRNPKTTYKNLTGIGSFYFKCKAQYDQLQRLFHYTFVYVQVQCNLIYWTRRKVEINIHTWIKMH